MLDASCLVFVQSFYAALANHDSVSYAFEVAAQSVHELLQQHKGGRGGGSTDAGSAKPQFLLLPEDANHDEVIFPQHHLQVLDEDGGGAASKSISQGHKSARASLPPPANVVAGGDPTVLPVPDFAAIVVPLPTGSVVDLPADPISKLATVPVDEQDPREPARELVVALASSELHINVPAPVTLPVLSPSLTSDRVSTDSSQSIVIADAAEHALDAEKFKRHFFYAGQFDDNSSSFDSLLRRLPALPPHFLGRDLALHELLVVRVAFLSMLGA